MEPILIMGSLQAHASVQLIDNQGGGICPTIGCTDLSLPRLVEMEKINIPDELKNRRGTKGAIKTCTIDEIVPYLPKKTCFFDIRHLTLGDDILPFAVTTRISANNQQFLQEMDDIKLEMVGKLDIKGDDYAKRIYSAEGIAPTQNAHSGGNLETKIAEPFIAASRGREPNVMSPKRTEYGKQIRKQYESHQVSEQRKHIQQLEPRNDGVCNTLTSAEKDNYLCEPTSKNDIHRIEPLNTDADGCATTITTAHHTENAYNQNVIGGGQPQFRIRKLTPRECFRLMDVNDEDIDKMMNAGISQTQMYKLAGNSIVVAVLEKIFDKMFVNTEVTEWTLF